MVEGEKVEKENEQLKTGERARERATKDLTWEDMGIREMCGTEKGRARC